MSKKTNPALIGTFVLIAVALVVIGMFVLGAGQLFHRTEPFVLYFEGSLSGLDVGAPVEYGGVRIGSVTDIQLRYNTDDGTVQIPVYIGINPERMLFSGKSNDTKNMEYHIQQGMRAQLQSQSFVTGKLKVMLLHDPDSPVRLTGGDPSVPEIPTIPTLLETLENSLAELPLADIVQNLSGITEDLSNLLGSVELREILADLQTAVSSLSDTITSPALQSSAESLSLTLDESRQLVERMNRNLDPTLQTFDEAMNQLSQASQSARYLLDYLERHPEALIYGKKGDSQ